MMPEGGVELGGPWVPGRSAVEVGAAHAPRNLRPHGPSRAPSVYQITRGKVKQDKKEKKNLWRRKCLR